MRAPTQVATSVLSLVLAMVLPGCSHWQTVERVGPDHVSNPCSLSVHAFDSIWAGVTFTDVVGPKGPRSAEYAERLRCSWGRTLDVLDEPVFRAPFTQPRYRWVLRNGFGWKVAVVVERGQDGLFRGHAHQFWKGKLETQDVLMDGDDSSELERAVSEAGCWESPHTCAASKRVAPGTLILDGYEVLLEGAGPRGRWAVVDMTTPEIAPSLRRIGEILSGAIGIHDP